MITFYEYAVLASHAYEPNFNLFGQKVQEVTKNDSHTTVKKTNLTLNGWYRVTDLPLDLIPNKHFYAALYIKFEDGIAISGVVAVRGTVFNDISNLLVDLTTWYSDVLGDGTGVRVPNNSTPYCDLTIRFVRQAQLYIDKYFKAPHDIGRLHVTGHSLGGALAQLVSLRANLAHPIVVFNSPGVGHIPGVMLDKANWVRNINTRYGVINKVGLTLGPIFWLGVAEEEDKAEALYRDYFQYVDEHKGNPLRYDDPTDVSTIQRLEKLMTVARSHYYSQTEQASILNFNQAVAGVVLDTLTVDRVNDIIMQQHSIRNMIKALLQQQNAGLAHRNFFTPLL